MKLAKILGKFALCAILFIVSWFLSFLVCGLVGSFFYDGTNKTAGAIYGVCIIALPIIIGTIATNHLYKKIKSSDKKLRIEGHNSFAQVSSSDKEIFFHNDSNPNELPLEPALPVYQSVSYSQKDIASHCNPNSSVKDREVDAELLNIDLMEGHEFEYWCASLLRKTGFSNVEVTQGSGDQGVDVLAEKDGIRYAIQCKCYSKDLGNKPVQEVNSGKMMPEYHCQIGVVMTNRYFTKGARDLADATGTLLWDRDWIKAHIQSTQFYSHSTQGHSQPFHPVPEYSIDIDELLPAAVDAILETKQASISMLQRRLNLGYAQAARTMDALEERGIVSPFCGSKPRDILITKEQWIQVKNASIH